ncbi:plant cysteine oxidase 1-like [Mangifera indica]|uniref:plant cysteine oxidase 1-like n=1 Tax=Mangifera indica TaxID=29780 RepID=UPI001CFA2A64|nr:plant cysteine oxidase 1-like [Mangifera indica]
MERSKVQVLYDACNAVFSQKKLPSFQQIQWLKSILDLFEAVDVGIDEFSLHGRSIKGLVCGQAVSEITYIHIHECDSFSIGVFCFPAGVTFPLHDHPGMTVLSKLLYGSLYVKAYDWVKVQKSSCRINGIAGMVVDAILNAPCEPSILFPKSGGNIHSFTALTPCAILDVLSPPYSEERPSTYFSDFPIPSLPGYAILEEIDIPQDLVVSGAPYLGPPVDFGDDETEMLV